MIFVRLMQAISGIGMTTGKSRGLVWLYFQKPHRGQTFDKPVTNSIIIHTKYWHFLQLSCDGK